MAWASVRSAWEPVHASLQPGARMDVHLASGSALFRAALALIFAAAVLRRPPARRRARPIAFLAAVGGLGCVFLVPAPLGSAPVGLEAVAAVLLAASAAWAIASAIALGSCFGVLPEARGMVTHGPYSVSRHPLYVGEIGAFAGICLAAPGVRAITAFLALVAVQSVRMRLEEDALGREFPAYRDYAARTARWLPLLPAARRAAAL